MQQRRRVSGLILRGQTSTESQQDKFLVEFLTLVSEEDENEKLREVVDATEVRPCPPQITVAEFDVMEKADAYDRDGWWVGRVTG